MRFVLAFVFAGAGILCLALASVMQFLCHEERDLIPHYPNRQRLLFCAVGLALLVLAYKLWGMDP